MPSWNPRLSFGGTRSRPRPTFPTEFSDAGWVAGEGLSAGPQGDAVEDGRRRTVAGTSDEYLDRPAVMTPQGAGASAGLPGGALS